MAALRLSPVLETLHAESGLKPSEVMAEVERLSGAYARGGPIEILDRRTAIAYTLYFLPEHVLKAALVFHELFARGVLGAGPLKVVDVGSGPGTAVWGLLSVRPDAAPLDCVFVDRSPHLLAIASRIAASLGGRVRAETRVADVAGALPDVRDADVVIFCNALSEIAATPAQAAETAGAALDDVVPNGVVVVIEPATEAGVATVTAIHRGLHDRVVIPCTSRSPCPRTASVGAVCTLDVDLAAPPPLSRVVTAGHRGQKFVCAVLARSAPIHPAGALRLIESFRRRPWGHVATACGGSFCGPLEVRDRGAASRRVLGRMVAGDVFVADGAAYHCSGSLRVAGASGVRVIHECTSFPPPT